MGGDKNTFVFCGGGSGGHVVPALTLMKALKSKGDFKILTIGSHQGIEAALYQEAGYFYKPISTGKLRRYFSWQNFLDIFRLFWGFLQSFCFLLPFPRKQTLVFSTGGFVTVPVVIAAWLQGKKVFIHEQTSRVGLANKIGSWFARKVFITFESSSIFFPEEKTEALGYPLREEIFKEQERPEWLPQKSGKRVLLLTGGGNGSLLLNKTLDSIVEKIRDEFIIVHQCGSLFYDEYKAKEKEDYFVFDFIREDMIPLMVYSDVVISRAGAGTVAELIALGKPSIYVPLKIAQKNEQFHNAKAAEEKLGSIVIEEDNLSEDLLLESINKVAGFKSTDKVSDNPTDILVKKIIEGIA